MTYSRKSSDGWSASALFVRYCNLANIQAKIDQLPEAAKNLRRAREHYKRLDHPLGALRIQWVEAMIKQASGDLSIAERKLIAARDGYSEAADFPSCGIISLDLAILYSEQNRWDRFLESSVEAVAFLKGLRLHEETLAAMNLLAQAIEAGEVSSLLLQQLRDRVRQDPLIGLLQ